MRRRVALCLAAIGWVAACSGDLFHSTDWSPPCAADGCGGNGGSGTGGTGEGGAGATGAVGGEGGAASGGAGGGPVGGAGGAPACLTCSDALTLGAPVQGTGGAGGSGPGGPPDGGPPFCTSSADFYDSVQDCGCAINGCSLDCVGNLCAGTASSDPCRACLMTVCGAALSSCNADAGG